MGKKSKKNANNNETIIIKTEEKDITEKTKIELSNNMSTTSNKIDFYKGYIVPAEKNIPFPVSYTTEHRVFIDEEVFTTIKNHSLENTSVEICGVLIGEVRYDNYGNYLYICGSIRGEKSKNSGVNVSFTPETWDYIHEVKEQKYPDYSIIGWYHSHPGFGIFLSDMDKFIQDNFFNMPYQVALVFDPKNSKCGIFAWQEGKIRPLQYCWIGKVKTKLEIGSVGGEETFIEKENNITSENSKMENQEKTIESNISNLNMKSNYYKQAFRYLLCFTLAFVLANLFNILVVKHYSSEIAQAETREILGAWAKDYSVSYDLDQITQYIDQYTYTLEQQQPATYALDIKTFKEFSTNVNNYLKSVSNNSKVSRNLALGLIKKISDRNIQMHMSSEQNMEYIKNMVAGTILMQIEPYLKSLTAQPISPNDARIIEARKLLDYILTLCPLETQNAIKHNYPWIFQSN